MTTINFDSAFMQRAAAGPDLVEVTGKHANGQTYCFLIEIPRGNGPAWIKGLGFKEWVEREQGTHVRLITGHEVDGPVDTLVSERGDVRTILTPMAKGYVAPKKEA